MRNFHSKNPAVERRLNVLYVALKSLYHGSQVAKFGVIWNFVSFLFLGAAAPGTGETFAGLTILCAASWAGCEFFGRALRKEWDKYCPCPACHARRELEDRIRKNKAD